MPLLPIQPLPTNWDSLFSKYRGVLPVPFMRALSKRESNLNPNEAVAPAYGLMQVVPTVRESWNKRTGDSWTQNDLLNPDLNVRMAADLINRIVKAYNKHSDPNMKADWGNPEFVNLVVAGWNSGYSEAGGVGRVAKYLESKGIPVTHDNVFKYASAAGATRHLQNPQKQAWQKSVTNLYFHQPDALSPGEKESSLGGFLAGAGVAVLVGLLAAKYVFK